MSDEGDISDFRAAMTEAVNQAKAARTRPLQKKQYRDELTRLIKINACLYAREHGLTQNIAVLRDMEKLEATVFINRTSVAVETVRQRAMDSNQEVWEQINIMMDLLGNDAGKDEG